MATKHNPWLAQAQHADCVGRVARIHAELRSGVRSGVYNALVFVSNYKQINGEEIPEKLKEPESFTVTGFRRLALCA